MNGIGFHREGGGKLAVGCGLGLGLGLWAEPRRANVALICSVNIHTHTHTHIDHCRVKTHVGASAPICMSYVARMLLHLISSRRIPLRSLR